MCEVWSRPHLVHDVHCTLIMRPALFVALIWSPPPPGSQVVAANGPVVHAAVGYSHPDLPRSAGPKIILKPAQICAGINLCIFASLFTLNDVKVTACSI